MSNFKKNIWGYGVVGVFILFAAMMISFAVYASHMRVDLVVTDYYKQELEFQKQLDKEHNANLLDHRPTMVYDSAASCIKLNFPDKAILGTLEGKVLFMRPDNPKRDRFVSLKPDDNGNQIILLSGAERGQWLVGMEWKANSQTYYIKHKMFFH